jgi:hypothetical protein
MSSIDIKTLQTLVALLKPAPIAPIAPVLQSYANDHDLLTTVSTTVRNIEVTVNKLVENNVPISEHRDLVKISASHETRIQSIEKEIEGIIVTLDTLKKIVYGACAFILTAVLSSFVYLVLIK